VGRGLLNLLTFGDVACDRVQPALVRKIPGAGEYWFRLFQKPYWNTTRIPNGRYLLVVRAWDAVGNRARSDLEIGIRNPPV